jgi:hypothetical protein
MLSSTDNIFKWVSRSNFKHVVFYIVILCQHCLHTENTGQKRLVRPVEEPSNNADNEDNFERSKNITELVSSDSVVAVKAEDDAFRSI